MIHDYSLNSDQYDQVLEVFSNYLNDVNLVMNSVKKSIYEILNINLHSSQAPVQPNIASVSANGKKSLDDLKRISSILRGYSRSKNAQRQEQQTKRSRIQNSSMSKQSQSRVSKYSNSNSSAYFSKYQKPNSSLVKKQDIGMVTFQVPHEQKLEEQLNNEEFISKLKHYRSLRNLSKTTQLPNVQKLVDKSDSQNSKKNGHNPQNIPLFSNTQNSPMSRKRARTLQKNYESRAISFVITQTQTKFKQCLSKHGSGMDEIIKRNGQCLEILKDIQKKFKNKKQNKNHQSLKSSNQLQKPKARYQAMTPSSKRQI